MVVERIWNWWMGAGELLYRALGGGDGAEQRKGDWRRSALEDKDAGKASGPPAHAYDVAW
jgi:hypothetical protein